ncbi:transcriptional regulator, IclR family [Amphibacillus marinus]|uniref:Transcriptional regulator, IclR family n=1 Tax=Amphibacillus marinus TaxID=872970 RepID=A0A1H8S886_9BACI|nr:IclR family transcriptional regulator [Amphibacillus marinus]SEO74940.1 transcriptional regulator, IclR family [Amphibacillus marinus]
MLKTLSLSLDILKMFTKKKPTWGGRELAAKLNQNHTKIYRILETLERHKYLIKNKETKKYSLGFAIWELGHTISENLHINEMIHPILEKLCEKTNESAFLTILDEDEGLTLDAVESQSTIRYAVSIGSRTPLYAGASYRAILAHLPNDFIDAYLSKERIKYTANTMVDIEALTADLQLIQQRGYAISEGEYTADVIAVAIPIFHNNHIFGSLTISGPHFRIEENDIELFIKELVKARHEVENVFEKYGVHFGLSAAL